MTPSFSFAFYSPSGRVLDSASLDRAQARLLGLGHRVIEDEGARAIDQRFAGSDEARVAAIHRVAARTDVDIAVPVRGGYGFSRLLDRLDYPAIARAGKRWLGHSDFTAFQLAALAQAGMVTFAGPMASYDFGAETPSEFTLSHCFGLLGAREYDVSCALEGPVGHHTGTLWGGNLTLVAHLVGTRYFPAIDGGILFLEDVAEHPYRIERMLYQLHYAGVLARQRAILLGTFTDYTLFLHDEGYDLAAAIAHLRGRVATPIYTGLPFGHVRDKLTLPVGGQAEIAVRDSSATLALSRYG
jgi:muramoyltetrapeptide carboxypeptidase